MSTKSYKPDYKSRLEAHKHRLESKSEESKMRILNSVDYLRTEGVEIAKTEVMNALRDENPVAAKMVGRVLGIKEGRKPARTHVVRIDRDEEGNTLESPRLSRLRDQISLRRTEEEPEDHKPSILDRIQSASWSALLQEVILSAGLAVGSSLLLAGTLRGVGSCIRGVAKGLFTRIRKGSLKL